MSNSPTRAPDLLRFVDALLEKRGVTTLQIEPEDLEQMRFDLYDDVDASLRDSLLALMTPEQQSKFATLSQEGDTRTLQSFMEASIPNLESAVADALMAFQMRYFHG